MNLNNYDYKIERNFHIKFPKWVFFYTLIVILGLLSSCMWRTNKPTYPKTPTLHYFTKTNSLPSLTLSPTSVSTPTPTSISITPTHIHTSTPIPTYTLLPTISPTFTETSLSFDALLLRTPVVENDDVITAFWLDDAIHVYYGLLKKTDVSTNEDPLDWFVVNLSNMSEEAVSSPPSITYPSYQDTLPYYYRDYPFKSPDGRYTIEIASNKDILGSDNDHPMVSSVWLVDNSGKKPKTKLLEGGDLDYRGAYWFLDDKGAVFGVGPEFGIDLYHLDVNAAKVIQYPATLINPGLLEWSLSPDGKMISVVTDVLQIFSLDGQLLIELPGNHRNVRWSRDSQALYYIQGEDQYVSESIYRYRIDTGTSMKIINWEDLTRKGVVCYWFEVSPDNNQILCWQAGKIWMITLR